MASSPETFEGDQRFAEKTLSQMEGNVKATYIYYIDRAGTILVCSVVILSFTWRIICQR